MGYTWPEDDEGFAVSPPPLSSRSHSHHSPAPLTRHPRPPFSSSHRYRPPGYRGAAVCPGFPYHTVASVYLGNLLITALAIFALLSGLESLPNATPGRFRQVATLIVGSLVGCYFLLHLATPIGALDGFIGAVGITSILCLAGAVPVALFPEFREILHHTTQPWLLSPHILRVLHFLFLPLYDVGLLPLGFAGPAGWGGLLVGLTAPVLVFVFGTKKAFAKGLALAWTAVGVLELLLVLLLEAAFIPSFISEREEHRLDTGYLWHTVLLVVHYTVPLLLILHGYSLWKLFLDKAPRPTMLWQEEDDAELANIMGPDSPGAQDGHVGIFDPVPPKAVKTEGGQEGSAAGEVSAKLEESSAGLGTALANGKTEPQKNKPDGVER